MNYYNILVTITVVCNTEASDEMINTGPQASNADTPSALDAQGSVGLCIFITHFLDFCFW